MVSIVYSTYEGYLYHIPGHLRMVGKGVGVKKIGTYPFTRFLYNIQSSTFCFKTYLFYKASYSWSTLQIAKLLFCIISICNYYHLRNLSFFHKVLWDYLKYCRINLHNFFYRKKLLFESSLLYFKCLLKPFHILGIWYKQY